MGFLNIETFRQQVAPGFQKLSKYLVRFPIPPILSTLGGVTAGSYYYNALSKMEFYATMIDLPGAGVGTTNIVRYGYGASEKQPFAPLFDDIQMTFYNDVNSNNLTYFQGWLSRIQNFNMSGGINNTNLSGISPYEGYYKDDYAVDPWVILLSETGEEQVVYRVRKLFPVQIFNTRMAWAAKDIMGVSVYFNFMDWYIESAPGQTNEQIVSTAG